MQRWIAHRTVYDIKQCIVSNCPDLRYVERWVLLSEVLSHTLCNLTPGEMTNLQILPFKTHKHVLSSIWHSYSTRYQVKRSVFTVNCSHFLFKLKSGLFAYLNKHIVCYDMTLAFLMTISYFIQYTVYVTCGCQLKMDS